MSNNHGKATETRNGLSWVGKDSNIVKSLEVTLASIIFSETIKMNRVTIQQAEMISG